MKDTISSDLQFMSSDSLNEIEDIKINGALYLEANYYPVFLINQNKFNLDPSKATKAIGKFELKGQTYIIFTPKVPQVDGNIKLKNILTGREIEIAILVSLGFPNKQIASHLNISEWTVSTHLRRIFTKLQVNSRAAMVYRCSALISQNIAQFS